MDIKREKTLRLIYGRTIIVVSLILIQLGVLLFTFKWLSKYQIYVYGGFTAISAILVLVIINGKSNPAYKLAWVIPVLLIPVFGGLFYLFVHIQSTARRLNDRHQNILKETAVYLKQDKEIINEIRNISVQDANLCNYISNIAGYPTYKGEDITYFPLGEDKFKELLFQLEKAEKFIFLEYFIIEESYMWDTILEILKRKVEEGVEVRVMYDGTCCLLLLPYSYPKELESFGIKAKMFSPIMPVLSTYQNNRDHRKILVIDGKVAFTGGINLGDEYINRIERFGHWKDTAIMVKGEAVRGFTMMFLQMWNITEKTPENYDKYLYESNNRSENSNGGFITPYGDSPFDDDNVGKDVYMDIINTAKEYVHIMTPYLILDNEMITTLIYAVKRGIDVKIILPHIPDKPMAFALAHNHYPQLLASGVKIYEYIPGFIHAKVFTSDNEKAVVGTINLDYRSLYLHFECAAYMFKCPVIKDIEEDFQNTLTKCKEMTLEDYKKFSLFHRLEGHVLKLFAPLM